MSRKVWVIERDGEPIASGVNEAEGLAMVLSPGCALVWYAPDSVRGILTGIATLLRLTGDEARAKAYDSATRPTHRAIFAGRADGFAAAEELVKAVLNYPACAPAKVPGR